MIDYKNLTDDELLEVIDNLNENSSKELSILKNSDPDFQLRLIKLAKKDINSLKSTYVSLIEHLEKAISNEKVPEDLKEKIKLNLLNIQNSIDSINENN
jgi:hypothetical protein